MPKRRNEITDYLLNQTEILFGWTVVGVYGGKPNWYGIDVDEKNIFGTPGLDERFKNTPKTPLES